MSGCESIVSGCVTLGRLHNLPVLQLLHVWRECNNPWIKTKPEYVENLNSLLDPVMGSVEQLTKKQVGRNLEQCRTFVQGTLEGS